MPQATNIMLVTITGPDQVGVVSSVTACLFDLGANLGDTAFSVLGSGFKFSSVVEFHSDINPNMVLHELSALPSLRDAEIEVSPFRYEMEHPENAMPSHHIEVYGGDRPGLLARLSEVFAQYRANVVRLNAVQMLTAGGEAVYSTQIDVFIPPETESRCLAEVVNTAGQLNLSCRWEPVES